MSLMRVQPGLAYCAVISMTGVEGNLYILGVLRFANGRRVSILRTLTVSTMPSGIMIVALYFPTIWATGDVAMLWIKARRRSFRLTATPLSDP